MRFLFGRCARRTDHKEIEDMEQYGQFLPWIAFGLVLLGMIALHLRKPPATAAEALAQVQEATEITRQLVAAAEQLWTTGRMPRDDRFDWVATRLASRYPDMDSEQAAATIEAAVYWLKSAMRQAQTPQ